MPTNKFAYKGLLCSETLISSAADTPPVRGHNLLPAVTPQCPVSRYTTLPSRASLGGVTILVDRAGVSETPQHTLADG